MLSESEQARLLTELCREKVEDLELGRARLLVQLIQRRADTLVQWVKELEVATPDSAERAERALRLLFLLSEAPGYLSLALVQLADFLESSGQARELFLMRLEPRFLDWLCQEAIEPEMRTALQRLYLLRTADETDFGEPISLFEDP